MLKAYLELRSAGYFVIKQENCGNRVEIADDVISIGRDTQKVDVALGNGDETSEAYQNLIKYISSLHCTIFYDEPNNLYLLVDNYSKNGVWINNERLAPGIYHPLKPNTLFQLGEKLPYGALVYFDIKEEDENETTLMENPLNEMTIHHALIPQPIKQKKIFISYSHEDILFVRFLNRILENARLTNCLDVWLDQRNIGLSDNWLSVIRDAVLESAIVVVIVSPNSLRSRWVQEEILFAMNNQKRILALQIMEINASDNFGLNAEQWLNLSTNGDEGFDRLIDELRKLCP